MPDASPEFSPSRGYRLAALALIASALVLLYPGLTRPVLTLSGSLEKAQIAELGLELVAGDDAGAQPR